MQMRLPEKFSIPYILQPNGSLDPYLMKKNRWIKKIYLRILGNYIINNASAIIFTSEEERRQAVLDNLEVTKHVVPVGLEWSKYENLPTLGKFRNLYPDHPMNKIMAMMKINHGDRLDYLVSMSSGASMLNDYAL